MFIYVILLKRQLEVLKLFKKKKKEVLFWSIYNLVSL